MRMFCKAQVSRRWSLSDRNPVLRQRWTMRRHDVGVFLVVKHLLLGHRHEQVLVGPRSGNCGSTSALRRRSMTGASVWPMRSSPV